jgi:5-methylthioadenosine/S-adenosylhomocysteine deaminase
MVGFVLDFLITGVTIVQPGLRSPVHDGVIGVRGNLIAFAGPAEPARNANADRRYHWPGRVAVPGFVNVHTHAVLSLMRGIAIDLGFAPAYTKGVPHGHDITPDEAVALARLGALEALTFGSTTMVDSYVHAEATLPAMAEIGGRIWSCTRFHDVTFDTVHEGKWDYDPAIGERCIRETLALIDTHHGKANGRTHVMWAPHAPDTCSESLLRKVANLSRETGLRVWTHLSQSRVENELVRRRDGCTPTELLDRCGLLTDELIAAHCIFLSDSDIARFGAAGSTVAHVPKGNATGGGIAPTVKLRDAGANIALATDNLTQDMTEAMRWALAVARIQLSAVSDEWQPRHALHMATEAGAKVLGMEGRLGCLTEGALADFVIFDVRKPHLTPLLDVAGTLVHDACGRDVQHVFVDGVHVIEDGKPTLVDADGIMSKAQAAAEAIWERTASETLSARK